MAQDEHSAMGSGLGKATQYVCEYDPAQLYPIPRQQSRNQLNLDAHKPLPFFGVDVWTAWELSWLNANGLPQVAVAEFMLSCESPRIIESKSFKLYLNSFNQTRFANWDKVREHLEQDLASAAGAAVRVELFTLVQAQERFQVVDLSQSNQAECLDDLDIEIAHYEPNPGLLSLDPAGAGLEIEQTLFSNLLKTNCPVTGQPDWATLWVHYQGPAIDKASLLAYLVSFRQHQDFHEHCVGRCFLDIFQRCQPRHLAVYARYTRRGGLDINPFRSTEVQTPAAWRLVRQ